MRRDSFVCYVCGQMNATIADHVVPVAADGSDDESNMRAICKGCHKKKIGAESHGQ